MRFKALLLVSVCALLLIGDVSARGKFSFGRSSSRTSSRTSYGSSSRSGSSSRGTSHGGLSHGTSHGGISHGTTHSGSSSGSGTSVGRYPGSSHPTEHSSGTSSKHISQQMLQAEGGGATRPGLAKPSAPPAGGKPGVLTESKQTSPYYPSAPHDSMMKTTTGTLQNQGQTSPSWSNPHLPSSHPSVPGSYPSIPGSHPSIPGSYPSIPGSHPSVPGSYPSIPGSHPSVPGSYPSVPGSYPNVPGSHQPVSALRPSVPGSQPPSIGFKDHVYPQTHPTSAGTQFSPPKSGQPPYPMHPMPQPSSTSWSSHTSPPLHQTNSMPLGNPYSMHPPGGAYGHAGGAYGHAGGAYGNPGVPHNNYGPAPYPQQPQMFAQPAAQPFIPGQTILMVPGQQQSGPGFGQLVKEALVFSTINAGVNRLINPHTHHYVESKPAEAAAPATGTHITYNNQYFNTPSGVSGAANPGVPQATGPVTHPSGPTANAPQATGSFNDYPSGGGAPNVGVSGAPTPGNAPHYVPSSNSSGTWNTPGNVASSGTGTSIASTNDQKNPPSNPNTVDNTPFYRISDEELYKISEELFTKDSQNISNSIMLNLQVRATGANVTDEAKYPLFYVEPKLLEYPTIYAVRSLYDSYEPDFRKKINRTMETRKKENLLIDTFLNTNEMSMAMQWLADRGFIDPDDFERKDVLRRIWFTIFSGSSSGFERVFASENYGTAIVGVQDWLYFHDQESRNRIDYMSYADKLNLGSTASLLKLNFQMDGIVRQNATIFVGTLPELEMALYTICFYARPNNLCPVSLGGSRFNIYTHAFTYFGSDVIDLALPMF